MLKPTTILTLVVNSVIMGLCPGIWYSDVKTKNMISHQGVIIQDLLIRSGGRKTKVFWNTEILLLVVGWGNGKKWRFVLKRTII